MSNLENQKYLEDIINYLKDIKSEIELYNGFKLYNINKFAEYFYAEFLNLLFGYNLEIMEQINPNMVAIDLGDKNGRIAIQVTSDTSREKIKQTVKKFNENNLNENYKRLVVLHIANKTPDYNKPHSIEKFDLKKDVWNIESLLSKMPIENIDKLKNIRDFLHKYIEGSPQISNLNNFLKQRYKSQKFTKLKLLSSLNKDVYIKDIYQNLSLFKKDKEQKKRDKEIAIDKILDGSKRIFILGKSGIGKSTLSKYICYQWANNKLFNTYEYLFYIPIKEWEKEEGLFDVILKVLKESKNEDIKMEANDLYEYIKTFDNTTLFVIDGFDEIKAEEQENIEKEIENFSNYIITSRYDGLKNNELKIEEVFKNKGFNQKSIEKFIGHIENNHELIKHINENNQLKELSKIPMLLDMICYLYKEKQIDFNNNFKMTLLYEKFLDEIILRFEKEREPQYNKIRKEEDDIFFELGKIAFKNLTHKNFKFKGTFITRSNRKFIENELLPFGFLANITNERHSKNNQYEFIHLSFQEYFSAFYVASLSKEEQSEIIEDWKFYPHMQMFFAFLGGLIEDKELLLKEIESEPKDLMWFYEFSLLLKCIKEIEEVSKKRKNKIFNNFWIWLDINLDRKNLIYKNNNDELSYITHIIDDNFIEDIFSKIGNKSKYTKYTRYLLYSLPYLGKNDDIFMDRLFKLATDINFIPKSLIINFLMRNGNSKIKNNFFEILKSEDIMAYDIKIDSNNQIYLDKNQNKDLINKDLVKKAIKFLQKNIGFSYIIHNETINSNLYHEKFHFKIDKKFKNGIYLDLNFDLKTIIAQSIVYIDKNDKIIKKFEDLIEDKTFNNEILKNGILKKIIKNSLKTLKEKYSINRNFKLHTDTLSDSNTNPFNKKNNNINFDTIINNIKNYYNNYNKNKEIFNKEDIFQELMYYNQYYQYPKNNINEYIKYSIQELLTLHNKKEIKNKFLKNIIYDDKVNENIKFSVLSALLQLEEDTEDGLQEAISLIETIKEDYYLNLLICNLFNIFKSNQFKIVEYLIKSKKTIDDCLSTIEFIILFQAYDNGYNILNSIIKKAFDEQNIIYINKKNRLCTIENGIEISTKKEVDKELLNILNPNKKKE